MTQKLKIFIILIAVSLYGTQNVFSKEKAPESGKAINKYNLRVNPIGLLADTFLLLNFDIGVNGKLTLGPELGISAFFDDGVVERGELLGVHANYYFSNRIDDAWLLGFSAGYLHKTVAPLLAKKPANLSGISISSTAGYQWIWKSGFNIILGLGLGYSSLPKTATAKDFAGANEEVKVPNAGLRGLGVFSLGYAF